MSLILPPRPRGSAVSADENTVRYLPASFQPRPDLLAARMEILPPQQKRIFEPFVTLE